VLSIRGNNLSRTRYQKRRVVPKDDFVGAGSRDAGLGSPDLAPAFGMLELGRSRVAGCFKAPEAGFAGVLLAKMLSRRAIVLVAARR
jgi:hypothetical protein